MKYLLTYSYISNQYELVFSSSDSTTSDEIDVLYTFESSDLRIAEKILSNLQLERRNDEFKQSQNRKAA